MASIPIVIIRPPIIYGPQDRGFYFYFKVIRKRIIPVVGKKLNVCFISDLIDGIVLAGESEKANGQVYFISNDEVSSSKQIGEIIAKLLGIKALKIKIPDWLILTAGFLSELITIPSKCTPIFNQQKAHELIQRNWLCDVSKARQELGFQPKVNLNEGLKITVDWYVKNKWL